MGLPRDRVLEDAHSWDDSFCCLYVINAPAICLTISIDVRLIHKDLIKVLFIKKYLGQLLFFF